MQYIFTCKMDIGYIGTLLHMLSDFQIFKYSVYDTNY